mmetsp:Transcript_62704/g.202247  ORF Transcript_62704/g.202247 Transcript_62704/m.202247 type:complete len:287 (-) Transcript_62704:79-939(-)
MESRERWLSEQPVAVLRAHAQECGINTSGCVEKHDLVQRILHSEPQEFSGRGAARDGSAPRPQPAQSQADLLADERLARQLQAEEAHPAAMMRGLPGAPRISSADGGTSPNSDAIAQLMSNLARGGIVAPGALHPAGHQTGPPGHAPTVGSDLAAAFPRVDLTARNGDEGELVSLLARLVGQVLASGDARDAHVLSEMLGSLMPQQGIDEAAVESRTATMQYSESHDGEATRGSPDERKCMVCLETFKAGDNLRILPCFHRYHRACIDPWLAQNRHCPVCKHDVTQ